MSRLEMCVITQFNSSDVVVVTWCGWGDDAGVDTLTHVGVDPHLKGFFSHTIKSLKPNSLSNKTLPE